MDYLSVLPALLAISLAIWKKEVILALGSAIVCSEFILNGFHPGLALLASIDRIVGVFSSQGNTEILLFSLLIGALLALIRSSGGVSAFVNFLLNRNLANGPRQVSWMTTLLGIVIFIESNLSVLTAGIFAQSLFDKYKLSRARLAYIIDSTCAPVSVLILLNGWGAYILGLLNGYGLENPVQTMIYSIPLNFYALLTLFTVFYTASSNKVWFALAKHEAEEIPISIQNQEAVDGKKRYFFVPLLLLTFGIVAFMFITGEGELLQGSGSTSVLYATILAITSCFLLLIFGKQFSYQQLTGIAFKGMGELLPLVTIVLLAFALGSSMQSLGTGDYIAGMVSSNLPQYLIPAAVFIAAAIISFCTGTSWGTFAILIPVAIPVALDSSLSPSLLLAAVLGGGVFGDHSSPISDSTVISSLASGSDHLTHVRTQLPYTLIIAAITVLLFTLCAWLM